MERNITAFNRKLLFLIEQGTDFKAVTTSIARKKLYNAKDIEGRTLMHYAVQYNNVELLQYLIESGSNIDAKNTRRQTPLMLAIINNKNLSSKKMIKVLIKADADIYVSDADRRNEVQSALEMIGQNKLLNKEILWAFLDKLQSDCSKNRGKIAKILFDAGWSLLQIVQLENMDLTEIMLQRYYANEIDKTEADSGKTALHLAAECADAKNVKVLLQYNANANAVDFSKKLPLSYLYTHEDSYEEYVVILKMLVERATDQLITARQVYNILEHGNEEAIKLLFQYNIDPTSLSHINRDSIVHVLATNKNPGVIQQIRNQKLDIEARNYHEDTPLMVAAKLGNSEVVEFLLSEGANVDAANQYGITALFQIIYICNWKKERKTRNCVLVLLNHDANVQIETEFTSMQTIFALTLEQKIFSISELLLAHLAMKVAQGIAITQVMRKIINSTQRFKEFFELSSQQLQRKIFQELSVFDLLTMTDKELQRQVRNDNFLSKLKKMISNLSNNYYYSTVLRKRMSEAENINNLKYGAACILSQIMETNYERFPYIIDRIINYLEHQDLKNLKDILA